MGTNSLIQWTTHTFNPWVGCTKVSAGCSHCYAEALDRRVGGGPTGPDGGGKRLRWGKGALRTRTTPRNWRLPLGWDKEAARLGERHRVFCASLADVFDAEVPDSWRLELFDLVRRTQHLDWLLLTKRPQLIRRLIGGALDAFPETPDVTMATEAWLQAWIDGVAPTNVWLGTTAENQEQAEGRLPGLLRMPAHRRFLSCEPLLAPVDLTLWLGPQAVSWVIVGGESGPRARAFDLDWAADVVRQCRSAAVAPFVKQLGAAPMAHGAAMALRDGHGGDISEWPAALRVRDLPSGGVE
jgi:protein gp37